MTQTALTLSEAADACGVSRSTVKRRQAEFTHAYQDKTGTWRVPVSDLLGAGLTLRRPAPDQVDDPAVNGADQGQHAQMTMLRDELAAERMARQVAETKVMLLTANLDDLRYSLRALNGPPRAPEAAPVAERITAAPEPVQADLAPGKPVSIETGLPPRRGLWARLRGN